MLSSHLRRFFATSLPKLNSFKQAREIAATKLNKQELKELIHQYHLGSWNYATQVSHIDVHTEEIDKHETTEANLLEKTYFFNDYKQAFAFMDASASIVDEMDHHPNWQHVDNEVDVKLNTHDIGNSISYKDILLARTLDYVAKLIKEKRIDYSLQEVGLNSEKILTEALLEDGIKQDRYADSLKPYQGHGRRPPDSRDQDRSTKSKEVKEVKRPSEKSGDASSSEHYSQKTQI